MKKILIGFPIVFVLLLVGAFTFINVQNGRALAALKAELREKGEPLTLAQAAPPPVPAARNAALVYERAFKLLPKESREHERVIANYASGGEARIDGRTQRITPVMVREALTGTGPGLELIEQAAAMPECRFSVNWEDGAHAIFAHQSRFRNIARLLAARAKLAAQEGRAADAVGDVETILEMSEDLAPEPVLISRLVQYAMYAIARNGLQSVMNTVSLSEADSQRLHERMEKMDVYGPFVRTIQGERAFGLWYYDAMRKDPSMVAHLLSPSDATGGDTPPNPWVYASIRNIAAPLFKKDEAFYLTYMQEQIERAMRHERAAPRLARQTRQGEEYPWFAFVSRTILPAFENAASKRDQAAATLALMQWALALDRVKRQSGAYPATLSGVKSVTGDPLPKDPFTGKDFVYRRVGNGFFLYSIGANVRDNGGWGFQKDHPDRTDPKRPRSEDEDDIAWWSRR